jgi:hypothetical protein
VTKSGDICQFSSLENTPWQFSTIATLPEGTTRKVVRSSSRPLRLYAVVDGQLHILVAEPGHVIPAYALARTDLIDCVVGTRGYGDDFHLITQNHELYICYGTEENYSFLREQNQEDIPGYEFTVLVRDMKVNSIKLYRSINTYVICSVDGGMFTRLLDRNSTMLGNLHVPTALTYIPPRTQIDGSFELHHSAVAATYDRLYVTQPDRSLVYLEFANPAQIGQTEYENVAAVAAGTNHVVVLHEDGRVRAELGGLSNQNYGQHTVPVDVQGVIAISCGNWMSYALRADGTVIAWGRDDQNQTTPLNTVFDVDSVHGGRHHTLVRRSDGSAQHYGSPGTNDANTGLKIRTSIHRLHSSDIRAVAILEDHRVVDVFDGSISTIAQDPTIVDVVASRSLYGLLHSDGRVRILNRFTLRKDDDALNIDPIGLAGVSAIYANGDVMVCVGFDGRVWALRSTDQFGYDPLPVPIPNTVRAAIWPGLSTKPDNYDADACHEANTLALRIGVITQRHGYLMARRSAIVAAPLSGKIYVAWCRFMLSLRIWWTQRVTSLFH